ncbi:MAG TPA: rod-binding protein [Candidatus Hydrogenedentes bacterium]|nr:rod-binding protein [Candidatus Hydrogenedentota bacterium]HRK34223.1 rod-binding protein [Candidatus Hydrogenedentota bacterium]
MLYVNPLDSNYARGLDATSESGRERLAYRELEHSFLKHLLDEMTKSISKDSMFGNGAEADFQRDMMNDALSGIMADSGQLGIAQQMEAQRAAALYGRSQTLGLDADSPLNSAVMRLGA